jgi:CheY-like chemotaxis protein
MDTPPTDETEARILIVDDKPENLHLLTVILKQEGYAVRQLRNGKMVMSSVLSALPDLILLDIMMPETDGYDVCRQLKAEERTRDIPVIFISALNETVDKIKAFSVGGIDYITKPLQEEEVLVRVETHLKLRRLQRQLEAQNIELTQAAHLREDMERVTRHDLKTPLNVIIGFPQIIMKAVNLPAKYQEYLKMIEESGMMMLNMIDLSLDMFKMERKMYHFQPVPVNLLQVIRRIMKDTESLAVAKKLSVAALINGKPAGRGDAFSVQGEELLCYSMLANLIKNALEASPHEERITIELADEEEMSVIRIHNRGAAPEDIRDRFFAKYATSGKESGTGLGTYSARLIAETQGGNVHFETSETKGTAVTVRLPGRTPEDMPKICERRPSFQSIVKDDELENAAIIFGLRCLPPEQAEALRNSAEKTHPQATYAVIRQIEERDAKLAKTLAGLVEKYRFDIIQELLEEV